MKNGFGRGEMFDAFTLSGTSEAENTSSSLPKPLDISGQLFSSSPSQYLETSRTSRLPLSMISAKSRQQTHIETRMIMPVGLELQQRAHSPSRFVGTAETFNAGSGTFCSN
jgi:hypothetical protein